MRDAAKIDVGPNRRPLPLLHNAATSADARGDETSWHATWPKPLLSTKPGPCTYKRGTLKAENVNGREIEFDWDDANIGHVARDDVLPHEVEGVIRNDPVDLGLEIVEGEERYLNLGATSRGR